MCKPLRFSGFPPPRERQSFGLSYSGQAIRLHGPYSALVPHPLAVGLFANKPYSAVQPSGKPNIDSESVASFKIKREMTSRCTSDVPGAPSACGGLVC